ncbi:MAG: fibronectin type III domain-containing protein [Rhizobacter sp.]|nr:fibronectin type III domain-containing protein [Rhizobacter sp.]
MFALPRFGFALATAACLALSGCGGGGSDSPSPTTTPPGATAQFVAQGTSAHTVSLGWTAPPAGDTPYAIERRLGDSGDYTRVATLRASAGVYVDAGLTASTAYTYRLVEVGATDRVLLSSPATTTDEEPVTSAAGTALGTATTTTMGTAGGRLVAPDGAITLDVPAGSLAADTEASVQATTNTAPDGQGDALRVHLGAVPTRPVTLTVRYDEAQAALADGLRIAVQRADGSWLSLPLSAIDKTARTLSAALPLEVLASPAASAQALALRPRQPQGSGAAVSVDFTIVKYLAVYLAPREARVKVGGTLEFVPYARVRGYEVEVGVCEPLNDEGLEGCILQPMLQTRRIPFLNTKPGYVRGWYVFLEEGGSATYGTVAPRGDVGAVYTAPRRVPDPHTVTVSFQSTHQRSGRTVVLASPVTIVDDQWVGTLSSSDGPSSAGTTLVTTANVTWHHDDGASSTTTDVYRAEGTLGAVVTDDNCTVNVSPSVGTVSTDPQLVSLEIDNSVSPPRYHAKLIAFWNATITGICPKATTSRPTLAGYGWDVSGQLDADGNSFHGSTMQETARIEWSFHR